MAEPRIRVKSPKEAMRGTLIEIMTLISHRMDTGLRKDQKGKVIPRYILNKFLCRYNGETIFSMDLHEAISANPLIQFHLVAENTGTLEFIWNEDGGQVYATTRKIRVL